MTTQLRGIALSLFVLGATWLGTASSVHADVMPPPDDAGLAADGAVGDAGPAGEAAPTQHTGLPPLGCTVAGLSVSLAPSFVLVLALGLARRRARR